MDASMVGVRLASGALTPLIKKLFRTDGDGAGLVTEPVRLSAYVSWREKRSLDAADLDRLATRLVARALAAPGERPLPEGEEAGVATALAVTLHALGDLTLTDAQAVAMGPAAFAAALRAQAPDPGLSQDAALFHERLLQTACLHILNFFTQRSTFVRAALVDQSRRLAEVAAALEDVRERLPRQDARDLAFETDYRAYLARRYGTLTIYGLDLEPGSERWPLDTAYVGLEVTALSSGDPAAPPAPDLPALWERAVLPSARASRDPRRGRVMLRGEAGSGKTTLIQYLAVTAARSLDALVPFVLPLRTLTRRGDRLPTPRDLLAAAGSALAGSQPEGWESRVLRAGRALMLVDGIDEIPEAERPGARAWLADLITAFPDNAWLVTSRPSAVRTDWLSTERFTEATLAPMNRDHVRTFIDRWHDAAVTGDPRRDAALPDLRDALRQSVRSKPELARLATSPLLCGLICALHRERHGFLPSGRKELYTAALSMLLHRRDRERQVRAPELGEEPQLQLLQRLAHWLIRNGRTELARDRAEELIAAALPAVPEAARVLGGAPAVHRHFLERTGLLRAPTEDTVEFVHRTFQDFLGARAALDEGSTGELALHADDDQWEDVIRMAVAQGRPRERAEIMRALLDRGTTRSTLLAVACLEYAAELDPALREEATRAAAGLWPPADAAQAERLGAAAGALVLDLLPDPARTDDERTAHLAVLTAAATTAEEAVAYLSGYTAHPSAKVRTVLAEFWPLFDAGRYAHEVVKRLDPPPEHLTLMSDDMLAELPLFDRPPQLRVRGNVSAAALSAFVRRCPVEDLDLSGLPRVDMLELRRSPTLRKLALRVWPALEHYQGLDALTGLTGLPVEEVALTLAGPQRLGPVLRTWARLRTLRLAGRADWAFTDLPHERLEMLDLNSAPASLSGLGVQQELGLLALGEHWRPSDPSDWDELSRLERLEYLFVHVDVLPALADHARLPALRELWYYSDHFVEPALGEVLAARFPRATVRVVDW
ncbi:NACHT domain-containing NTPase [Streptomyces sp. WAC06614]|uniref:NACHT domain-containing protein n=1 Tax=Streptomyces sp. WAC06614 TaxID=2487416 RepID=UPI000F7B0777|nr:NACHT domain-containing protein [Streptomyces sp. WAC06614]RSS79356.1 NACHT domain-containing protein [Streptomyces sp. WAC06614]